MTRRSVVGQYCCTFCNERIPTGGLSCLSVGLQWVADMCKECTVVMVDYIDRKTAEGDKLRGGRRD